MHTISDEMYDAFMDFGYIPGNDEPAAAFVKRVLEELVTAKEDKARTVDKFTWGILPRLGSFWIGFHYASKNKRLCINIIPCLTLWFVWPGGVLPVPVKSENHTHNTTGNYIEYKGKGNYIDHVKDCGDHVEVHVHTPEGKLSHINLVDKKFNPLTPR